MREAPFAPGGPVGEVDRGVHPTDGSGRVRLGQVEGEAVVEGHRARRDLDEHGRHPFELASGERVLAAAGEDVDELTHSETVAAGQVAHGTALQRRAVEGDPRGDRVGFDDRPVGLVLVRIGLAPARLLVERLVVPDPDGVDPEQSGRRFGDDGMERERADVGAVLPQVLALREALLVARLLGQCAGVVPAAPGDGLVDRRPEAHHLVGAQEIRHHHEPVAPEVLDELGRQRGDRRHAAFTSQSRRGSRGCSPRARARWASRARP